MGQRTGGLRLLATIVAVLLTAMLPVVVAQPAAAAVPTCGAGTFTISRVSSPVLYLDAGDGINSAYEGYSVTNSSGATVSDVWVSSGGFAVGADIHLNANSTGRSHLGPMTNGSTQRAYFYLTADGTTTSAESHTISVYTTRPDLASAAACTTTFSMTAATDLSASANKVTGISSGPTPPQVGGNVTITISGNTGTIGTAGIFAITPASFSGWRSDVFKLTGVSIVLAGTTYNDTLYLSGLASGGLYTATFTFAVQGTTTTSTAVSPMAHISSGAQMKHTTIDATYQSLSPIQQPVNNVTVSTSASPSQVAASGGSTTYSVVVSNPGSTSVTLDDVTATVPSGPSYTASSATWNGVAVSAPTIAGSTLTFVGQFTTPASSTRTFAFSLTYPGTAGSYSTSVVAHAGNTQIDTSTDTTSSTPSVASIVVLAPPPTVTSVSPSTGSDHGGTTVTITGTNFAGVSAVKFGATDAASYTVNSTTQISATSPVASAGTVDVTVVTPTGTSSTGAADHFTFTTPPNNPPSFTGAATNTAQYLLVGGTPSALVATDPDNDPLSYAVTSGSLPSGLTLNANGSFSGTASSAGSTTFDVTASDGYGGTATTTLTLSVRAVETVVVTGGPTIVTTSTTPTISGTSTAPSGSTLTVAIEGQSLPTTIQNDSSWTTSASTLSYGSHPLTATVSDAHGTLGSASATIQVNPPAPTVTSIAPSAGPLAGGTGITITGTNFSNVSAVSFGATPAVTYTVASPTSITAVSPAGSAGTTDVTVTTTGGTSATSSADQFTYVALPSVTSIAPTSGPTSGGTTVVITGTNLSGATAVQFGSSTATGYTVDSATQITATAPAEPAGAVDISVTTAGSTSSTSSADIFTYVSAPAVSGISPTSGPTAGGTTVVITGTNLTGATAVSFGGTPATGFTVNSATQITATSPAGSAGSVDVTVTTVGGTSSTGSADQFTYVHAPAVTGITPTSGPTTGGTTVVITGGDLTGATAVSFGGTPATGFTVNSATQITATSPAGSAGTVDVTVTTIGGTSTTSSADQFTYVSAPAVTGISPTSGRDTGGTTVVITGATLSGATAVSFGGTPATGFTVNSATQITATAPAGSAGTVDVTVTTVGGTSPTGSADRFTYIANNPPSFTANAWNTQQDVLTGQGLNPVFTTDDDNDTVSYSMTSGTLPPGITLGSDGSFTGTITAPATTTATIEADDHHGGTTTTTLVVHARAAATVVVTDGPTISTTDSTPTIDGTTTAPPGSTVTVAVNGQTLPTLVATGGTWSTTAATLPIGTYPLIATASDTFGTLGSITVTLLVGPPPLPSIPPVATTGLITAPQTTTAPVPIGGSASLLQGSTPTTTIVIPGQGTYALDPATGTMTFTPVLGFRGTPDPVTYQVTDAFGQTATATFSPVVVGPTKGGSTDVTPTDDGYWAIGPDGGVIGAGSAQTFGSMRGRTLNAPVVGFSATATGQGYWQAGADGGVFAFGDAPFVGSMAGTPLAAPVVGIASTPNGGGYWMAGADGGVFAFGNAAFFGSAATLPLRAPVVAVSPTLNGRGYWLVAADGGVFAFGEAPFFGSMADIHLNAPIVGISPTPDGQGYWLASADGGVFAFGNAQFFGSAAGHRLASPTVGIIATPDGRGYSLVTKAGGTINFGNGHL